MILDDILARTRADLPERKARTPLSVLERRIGELGVVTSLRQALRQPGRVTAIAEFKRRSPSAGFIREDAEIAQIVPTYVVAGAAALSILTDGPFFGGSLADLTQARTAAPARVPILRKDFVIDEYQIAEARAAGADAVLLIVAALDEPTLRALFAACGRWGVEALVETHSADEAERAVALGAAIIGVNHRDLQTFTLDMELAARLRARIPPECVMVAESGIRVVADVERMALARIDAILVGEALMRAADPGAGLRALLAANHLTTGVTTTKAL
jgi:indole-3-glycerol phosphate synthase